MKLEVHVNLLALQRGLRAAYWCISYDSPGILKALAKRHGLAVSERHPRLVYNPRMTDDAELSRALSNDGNKKRDEILTGKLFGYPSPGEYLSDYDVRWEVMRPGTFNDYDHLFAFQMKVVNFDKLLSMKKRWNDAIPEYYITFQIRPRNEPYDKKLEKDYKIAERRLIEMRSRAKK